MPVLVLLLVTGLIELTVLVAVGQAIGVVPTLLLLIATSVLGGALLRREGRRALGEFQAAALQRRPPHRELADGAVLAGAGVLITLPGFVTDVAGLLCLLPPVRALLRGRLGRWARRRAAFVPAAGAPPGSGARRRTRAEEDVIDGEVVSTEDDAPQDSTIEQDPPVLPPQRGQHPNGG